MKRPPAAVATLVLLAGASNLVSDAMNVSPLASLFPGAGAMVPNASAAFILAGIALWARACEPRRFVPFLAQACALSVIAIGAATSAEYIFGRDLGIDSLLFRTFKPTAQAAFQSRMAPTAALNFVLCGAALLRLHAPLRAGLGVADSLPLATAAVAMTTLTAYLYGVDQTHALGFFTHVSAATALTFLALAAGILSARPDRGVPALWTSDSAGGAAFRRLFPIAVLLPLLMGGLTRGLIRLGFIPDDSGEAVLAMSCAVPLAAFIYRHCRGLDDWAEAQRRASAYNRSLIDASLDPLVTIGADGRITDVNRATEKVTGRPRTELVGSDFCDYFSDPGRAKAGYRQVFTEGSVRDYALELEHRDGRRTPVLYNAAVYRDGTGQVAGVFAVARDVTELKKAEDALRRLNTDLESRVTRRTGELERANKELEAFAYSVSHDLRAPLRGVDGFSKILLDDFGPKLEPECRRYLTLVRESAQEMGRLIDDLLKFSRLSRQPLIRVAVSMAELVRGTIETLAPEREGRKVRFAVGDLPPCDGDPALLKQVWANLLSNALKFTRHRDEAIIEFGARQVDGETAYWIKDNGAGFDMRHQDKLFKVFQRLHGQRDYEGTGVGMAIVSRIVERHGGRVWGFGEPERGATFSFTLGRDETAPLKEAL